MEDFIITTTHQIEGYEVTSYIDVIFEESIFGMSAETGFKAFGDMFKGWTGERFDAVSDRIAVIKEEIKKRFIRQAIRKNANAIIGVDIETTRNHGDGTIGISMSGTAVVIKKI